MALSHHQRKVLREILRAAQHEHASRNEVVAAVETGLAEANLGNPNYGDRTSVGWRQELKSSYPNVNRMNVYEGARRYFQEARGVPGRGHIDPAVLAQAVQRSGFPSHFKNQAGLARAIVRKYWDNGTGTRFSSPTATPAGSAARVTVPGGTTTDTNKAFTDALLAHAAGRRGGGLLQSVVGGIQSGRYTTTLPAHTITVPGAPGSSHGHTDHGRAKRGNVTLAPNADRAGARTHGYVLDFVRRVAGAAGRPLTIGTGTNHNRLTVNGNVSDHWGGNAADIPVPVDSRQGDMIAGRALMLLGVPRAQARHMAQTGGLWTITRGHFRYQVIWRTTQGGNHHNHVHIGVRPV